MTPHYYKNKDKVNPHELFITRGQCLADFQLMLNNTLEELSKVIDRPIEILDPCCGTKALECADSKFNINYTLMDIQPIDNSIIQADFITYGFNRKYDLIICNPPFSYAKEFGDKCLKLSDNVIFISPLNKQIPNYERSIKLIYKYNFGISGNVGIYHYKKDENNIIYKGKLPSLLNLSRKYLLKIDKATYEKEPQNWLLVNGIYIDPRILTRNSIQIIEQPSIYNMLDDLSNNKLICEYIKNNYDLRLDNEPTWVYGSTNSYVKKGQPKCNTALRTINKEKLKFTLLENIDTIIFHSCLRSQMTMSTYGYIAIPDEVFEKLIPYLDLDYYNL